MSALQDLDRAYRDLLEALREEQDAQKDEFGDFDPFIDEDGEDVMAASSGAEEARAKVRLLRVQLGLMGG